MLSTHTPVGHAGIFSTDTPGGNAGMFSTTLREEVQDNRQWTPANGTGQVMVNHGRIPRSS
jgi:hypothetical protein